MLRPRNAAQRPHEHGGRVFIEEYLQDLRRDHFTPRATWIYIRRTLQRAREDMVAASSVVRSLWSVALVFFAGTFVTAAVLALGFDRHLAYDFFLWTALSILPSFILVTLHIGMFRDQNGYRLSALNLPTMLTLLRVLLVPGIALFLVRRHYTLALLAFVLASVTDILDGWLARRWNQITRLGTVMDPLVDIVFNFALLAALSMTGLLKPWVFWVASLRYAILLVGGAFLYVFVGPVRIYPTLFGRLTGMVMAALVGLLMLLHARDGVAGETLTPLTEIALGVLLSATVAQVLTLGWYNLRVMTGEARSTGRLVSDVRWGAR